MIDIVVPVYRGLTETRTCLESVLNAPVQARFNLLIIDDCCPDPELRTYLKSLAARDRRVQLLQNDVNLGFVASVDRGMKQHPDRDVVLLNSDTEVANDWLDRLQRCALRSDDVGTATPFSNNATICSYPRFCEINPLPDDVSIAELDRIFARVNAGHAVDIPTAVGFCMYIRRRCLEMVGSFDLEQFGKGYGEENDFCMRAAKLGWRHVLCGDTFVYHVGSVSFAEARQARVEEAQRTLAKLHPHYGPLVHDHISRDPARPLRAAVDLARLKESQLPCTLFITHGLGGGTERHVRELAAALEGQMHVLTLRPEPDGQALLSWEHPRESLKAYFRLPGEYRTLKTMLRRLGVARIHIHHLLGHDDSVRTLARDLNVPYDFTAHDYFSFCPHITVTDVVHRYCGEPDEAGCNQCLRRAPAGGARNIEEWRGQHRWLVEGAARVFAPTAHVKRRLEKHFPEAHVIATSHPDAQSVKTWPVPTSVSLAAGEPLRVLVLGALSPVKGADILEQCGRDAHLRRLPLDFHLLGYAYRPLQTRPHAAVTEHGRYQEHELAQRMHELKPHLVWFPAQWPETYSYTLSAALIAGLPIVSTNLGGPAERLAARSWTWMCPWESSPIEWNDFFVGIREANFLTETAPRPSGEPATLDAFDYRRDYLTGIRHVPGRGQFRASELQQCVYPHCTLPAKARKSVVGLLRKWHAAHPTLRQMTSLIPSPIRYRLKNWVSS